MTSLTYPVLILPCIIPCITSFVIDSGISRALCKEDETIEFPFQCRKKTKDLSVAAFDSLNFYHGSLSYVSSSMVVVAVPFFLGLGPFGSSMGVSLFTVIWGLVGFLIFYLDGKN